MSFFASLRFAQNDRYLNFPEEVVGGNATNHLLLSLKTLSNCHSEQSEESHTINKTAMLNMNNYYLYLS